MNISPRGAVESFFSQYTKLQYKKGEVILRAGDPPAGVLYLKRGFVRMSLVGKSGDTLVLHVFKVGAHFPMTWAVNDTPNRYSFEALTPAEIWRAPKEDVLRFLRTHPEISEFFLSRILRGVSGLMERMEYLVLEPAYEKTVLLLLYYAKNFSDGELKGKLIIPLTHREIAGWIGTTRETASLQIEILKKKKFLTYNRRLITIPDVALLAREVTTRSEFV